MGNHARGFTLIELLVVIAIIGLLSSVVLASLNTARSKAKDAAIKEAVHQLASTMALNYSDYGSYCQLTASWLSRDGACGARFSGTYASKATAMCNDIVSNAKENNWGAPGAYKMYINSSLGCANSYSIMVQLNDGNWYCSGSGGAKGEYGSYNLQPGCYNNP